MTSSVDREDRAYVKRSLTQDDLVFLKELQHELNNQPTLATADPRFWVIRDYVYREATDGDDIEAVELSKGVIKEYAENNALGCVFLTKLWAIVPDTMFLTLREAEEHLKANYYHYSTEAHTFGMHAWRSPEVAQLIKLLHTVDFDELSKLVSKE